MKNNLKTLSETVSEDIKPDLTPMIDIVFLLLLFFIVTSTFKEETLLEINLPKTDKGKPAIVADTVKVSISKEGTFTVENEFVTEENLGNTLQKYQKRHALIISGDRDCPYEKVVQVMESAKALDFSVALLLEKDI